MNLLRAETYLDTFGSAHERLSSLYDDDDMLRSALAVLFPAFEYPDYSYLTMGELRAKYAKQRLPLPGVPADGQPQPVSPALREQLLAQGFEPTTVAGRTGDSLVKRLKAADMPYFAEHIVDGSSIALEDVVVVEVLPGDLVLLRMEQADYSEEPVAALSMEGVGLLADAGVTLS